MQVRNLIAVAAIATVGFGLPAAQAQTITSQGTANYSVTLNTPTVTVITAGSTYQFLYTGLISSTNGAVVNSFTFNFLNPLVTTGTSSFGIPLLADPTTGTFFFYSPVGLGNGATPSFTFTTTTPLTQTSTLGVTTTGSGNSLAAGTTFTGPVAAPEPSGLASMAVLGTCLGLGLVARKRKTLAA